MRLCVIKESRERLDMAAPGGGRPRRAGAGDTLHRKTEEGHAIPVAVLTDPGHERFGKVPSQPANSLAPVACLIA